MSILGDVKTENILESDNLCPSYVVNGGCYDQVGQWDGQDGSPSAIRCQMNNSECLRVSCEFDRIKAEFRRDLFDSNPDEVSTFLNQIKNEEREVLGLNNVALVPGPCYFTVGQGDFTGLSLNIDWSYEKCGHLMQVDLVDDEVIYKISLSVRGDDNDGDDRIEFYVDHKFGADCKYPASIELNESFWVNQEDVEAHKEATGDFEDEFTCDFYSDEGRAESSRINSDNIVNMGDTIYGQVTSKALFGLSYELTQVTVTDGNNNARSFNVIENGESVDVVNSDVEDRQVTGGPLNFNWMSFGFQGYEDQNKLEVECQVNLRLNGQVRCPAGYEIITLSDGDKCAEMNYGKFR